MNLDTFEFFRSDWEYFLREAFASLWYRLKAKGDPHLIFEDLLAHYREAHRHYHTETHLAFCLAAYNEIRKYLDNPLEVEMAIFFHDVIYQPGDPENEEKSAAYAAKVLGKTGLPLGASAQICNLILATKHNQDPLLIEDNDTRYMLDIDLHWMGTDPERFEKNNLRIRQEISDSAAGVDNGGSLLFYKELLRRTSIFCTDSCQKKYEGQARENLKRLIG
jgi:predicted metal-dependent HD superfamily phosphohydrolase